MPNNLTSSDVICEEPIHESDSVGKTRSQSEVDITKAIYPAKIVFCLTGNNFSGKFLDCWSEMLGFCLTHGIQPILSRKESCNIYYVRNMCLGADVTRGKYQKPFDGKLDYDYLLWIDSDILFSPSHLVQLLKHNQDIVSGIYLMSDGKHCATVRNWDEEYFKQHGCFEFSMPGELSLATMPACDFDPNEYGKEELAKVVDEASLVSVAYTGMGFMLVKKGVFESLEYPWFRPLEKQIGNAFDFTMEDVAFALRAQEKGYKIFVDPKVRVGHEKKMVL